jgi:hypothetical protein
MGVFVGFVFISAALMIYDAEAISVEVAMPDPER